MRQRIALLGVLAVGVVLRVDATIGAATNPDAENYVLNAAAMRWFNPWEASYREPLWELFVKITTGPFGYSVGALQVVVCVTGIVALIVCVWALRQVGATGWILIAGVTAISLAVPLIETGGQGAREPMAVLISAIAVGLTVRAPRWLPILAAATLVLRWEMGLALVAVSVALALGRTIGVRSAMAGAAVAGVLVAPFLVSNDREYRDPMFHSNVHATFHANKQRAGGAEVEGMLPSSERIVPDLGAMMYRAPVVSWREYVTDVVGVETVIRREVDAAGALPVEALRLGRLPIWLGVVLLGVAVVGGVRRRDRVVLVLAVLSAATVFGYGLVLPWLDHRLVSHLTALLVMLLCASLANVRTAGRGSSLSTETVDPSPRIASCWWRPTSSTGDVA